MSDNRELKITSFQDLKTYAEGEIVELPAFSESQPFVARIKRPSMLELVKTGQIPNPLLGAANKLFIAETDILFDESNEKALAQMFDIMDVLCDAAFLEPTYEEIKNSGMTLSDDQYMFIFNYCQNGVKALESFRR